MSKKIFLILGASSDVGKAYIQQLEEKKEEAIVIAHFSHSKEALESLKDQCKSIEIDIVQADLTNLDATKQMINDIKMTYGEITHLLHLAALPFDYMRIKQWNSEKVMEDFNVQVMSFAEVLKVFLPIMAKKKFGRIVVMLTSYTLSTPPKFMSNYIMVKYALLGLLKGAAIEYASKGITINALSPNMMETKFLKNIDERTIEMSAMNATLSRNIRIDEVIPSIQFLMSDQNSYMTGMNLNLSGGDNM